MRVSDHGKTPRGSTPWLLAAALVLQGWGCVGPGLEPPGEEPYQPGNSGGSGGLGGGFNGSNQGGDGDTVSDPGLDLGGSPSDGGVASPDAGLDADAGS